MKAGSADGARHLELPAGAVCYRTIGPFDAASLPAGLRAAHRLKPGTWGLITLTSGAIRFLWDDDAGGICQLSAPAQFIIPPETPHHVESDGSFELTIGFHHFPN